MSDGYAGFLGEGDLEMVSSFCGAPVERLASTPGLLADALAGDELHAAIFDVGVDEAFVTVTSSLAFAVLVEHGAGELAGVSYVRERIGSRQAIPLFDTPALVDFVAEPQRRVAMVRLLASYTKVASGPTWTRQGNRWRKGRFSELDPVQLAGLLDQATGTERVGVYQRLGDLALFMTGVFPDHAASRTVTLVDFTRLMRSLPVDERRQAERVDLEALASGPASAVYEWLGRRWYRNAADAHPYAEPAASLRELAERFDQARRFLTYLTDRYLFASRSQWFPFDPG